MGAKLPSVETVFGEAMEIAAPAERAAFLDRACGGDATLRRQVESLLDAHTRAGGFLESPAATPTITVAARPPAEGPGAAIGPYKLLEEIGEGGMGVVYMAEQTHPVRRRVALKVIKPGMDSRQVVARFEAERQALALMDHPNIAKVHDAGATESGRPYFVMELVRGLPITEYCDREGLTVPERLELFVLVCRAVQHAHQKGVIHRDLKPSNILVTVIDGVPTPKVIDFGVAKATGGSLTDRSLFTGFHQMIGTPLYMSPEQADLSSADVDTRSDIYALGVLLYELLTGSTPFDRDTFARAAFDEMRRIIREDEPPRPSTRLSSLGERLTTVSARRGSDPRHLNRAVRGELDWIAMKALEKDRRRRYETASDFAADVMRYLTDRPVEACPPTARYRLGKYARRHRAALTTGALVALALVAGTAVSTWQAVRAARAERRAVADGLRAERRGAEARLAVDEMYTQVAERWLAQQPSLTAVQRQFLEKALAFYVRFAAEAGDDPGARKEVIEAEHRVGKIHEKLGHHAEAEAAYRRAVRLGEKLVADSPDAPGVRRALARAGRSLGELLRLTGRTRESEEVLSRAVTPLEAAHAGTPEDRVELAAGHHQIGLLMRHTGRAKEAEAAYRKALAQWEELVRVAPAVVAHREGLAGTLERLAGLLSMNAQVLGKVGEGQQMAEQAEVLSRRALGIRRQIVEDDPARPEARNALAMSLFWLGAMLRGETDGRLAEAQAAYTEALKMQEKLVAESPEVPGYRKDLGAILLNLGSALQPTDLDESRRVTERGLEVQEKLASDYPDVPDYRSDVGGSLHNVASALAAGGELEEARRLLERAIPHQQAALAVNPGHPNYRRFLWNHHWLLADVALRTGRHAEAAREAEAMVRAARPDMKPSYQPYDAARVLARCIEPAGRDEALPVEGRRGAAWAYADRARSLIRQAAARAKEDDPGMLVTIASFLCMAPAAEVRDPGLAIELCRRAIELEPKLGDCWIWLGLAQYRAGEWDAAVASIEKGLALDRVDNFHVIEHLILALVHGRRGDLGLARERLAEAERVLAKHPGWERASPDADMVRSLHAEAIGLLGAGGPGVADDSK